VKICSYRFVHSRSAFCVPAFNITSKFLAGIKDSVVIFLIVNRSRYTVPEHAFGQTRKLVDRVLLQKRSCSGRIPFRYRSL